MPLTPLVDTYATEAELQAYADARGVTLAKDSSVLLTLAMDYLEGINGRWKGTRTSDTQPLAWPRKGVYVDGVLISDAEAPQAIKTAQIQLAIQAEKIDLTPAIPVGASGSVTSKSVGDVSVGYGSTYNAHAPQFPSVMRGLGPYLGTMGGSNFNVARI